MKTCSQCKITQPYSEFYKKGGYKDGYCSWCKTCISNYNKSVPRKKARAECGQKIKKQVINYYGGKCSCCGESQIKFLTIDHINGDGCKHRKDIGRTAGRDFYYWLRHNNFPDDYQVLCFNCNCGRSCNGGICPHKEEQR